MYASATSFSFHEALLVESHTRRLLLLQVDSPAASTSSNSTDHSYFGTREFDANVVMILAVLLCAFICSLALNSIIRCALRFSNIDISNVDSSSSSSSSSNNSSTSPQLMVNQGIKKKALKTFPTVSYNSADLKLSGLDTECVICISEFKKGEKVRILPKCNHGFHVKCIDKWLRQHSSCPTCRHCLIQTCQKIVGSQQTVLPVLPQTIIRIHPLEHEDLERNYRGSE